MLVSAEYENQYLKSKKIFKEKGPPKLILKLVSGIQMNDKLHIQFCLMKL